MEWSLYYSEHTHGILAPRRSATWGILTPNGEKCVAAYPTMCIPVANKTRTTAKITEDLLAQTRNALTHFRVISLTRLDALAGSCDVLYAHRLGDEIPTSQKVIIGGAQFDRKYLGQLLHTVRLLFPSLRRVPANVGTIGNGQALVMEIAHDTFAVLMPRLGVDSAAETVSLDHDIMDAPTNSAPAPAPANKPPIDQINAAFPFAFPNPQLPPGWVPVAAGDRLRLDDVYVDSSIHSTGLVREMAGRILAPDQVFPQQGHYHQDRAWGYVRYIGDPAASRPSLDPFRQRFPFTQASHELPPGWEPVPVDSVFRPDDVYIDASPIFGVVFYDDAIRKRWFPDDIGCAVRNAFPQYDCGGRAWGFVRYTGKAAATAEEIKPVAEAKVEIPSKVTVFGERTAKCGPHSHRLYRSDNASNLGWARDLQSPPLTVFVDDMSGDDICPEVRVPTNSILRGALPPNTGRTPDI